MTYRLENGRRHQLDGSTPVVSGRLIGVYRISEQVSEGAPDNHNKPLKPASAFNAERTKIAHYLVRISSVKYIIYFDDSIGRDIALPCSWITTKEIVK
ncbi:hypothetical protein Pr1d_31590 [Bythopirellula goksoeyrii]|uniref:Uncharacterized protein n=1 Tax=Bythopirellula goksoeyrii TaxID=1400387 RepID=A0A5B9QPE0_9BACT|nr:hypothetical protein Pr1d_31590 [Bythopirellula goksoeyrii]